jgi:hypothetical protein
MDSFLKFVIISLGIVLAVVVYRLVDPLEERLEFSVHQVVSYSEMLSICPLDTNGLLSITGGDIW